MSWIHGKELQFVEAQFTNKDVCRYIRSTIPLDDLERRARYPMVDVYGHEVKKVVVNSTRGS